MAEEWIASTYQVLDRIGAGGGGVVYLANHTRLGKQVILKADKRKISTRPELLRREVDILKDLHHPYIPQVYDFFVENDVVYTVMDFIAGESLDKPLRRGERYPQSQVIQWAIQLLEALSYLHSPTHGDPPRGYVHSDIKPANLMRTPKNNICLIDFNIALALGEENVIGCSAGYASPEHYGLDFSTDGDTATQENTSDDDRTVTMAYAEDETKTMAKAHPTSSTSKVKTVVPDVRSDIYSVGATLYHLLSGKRPARNAKEVQILSEEEFSPQIVKIIAKSMNPNPDLRYQSAQEMLDAFLYLHENDPRTKRLKKRCLVGNILFSACLICGVTTAFTGLKRMQTAEQYLKLSEYSRNALADGDIEGAVQYALEALPEDTSFLKSAPPAEAQKALTDALGVYDLADGYKSHKVVELPSAPLCMALSTDGQKACCIYSGNLAIVDIQTACIITTLPAESSALSEVRFLDNNRILYAGKEGIEMYDIENGQSVWHGKPATSIQVSEDGRRAAAVYREETFATVYDTATGEVVAKVDFGKRHQQVTINDLFANPQDNLLALNQDGTLLGASFSDGSLQIFDLEEPKKEIKLLEAGSGYTHFEGGFSGKYFAFSASDAKESAFAVMDMEEEIQTGGFTSEGFYSVQTREDGIYLKVDNLLVELDPVTGEQRPLVTISEPIRRFAISDIHTLITTDEEFLFFDQNAHLLSRYTKEQGSDLVQIANGMALLGSSDLQTMRIMKYENYTDAEIFAYDANYLHDEARVSEDGKYIMLFSFEGFRVHQTEGELVAEVEIPEAKDVYDQQYIRDEEGARLEVIYNDGKRVGYSAKDGSLLYEEMGEKPDKTLYEEFYTDTLRMESPLHGTPAAYDIKTGKLVRELSKDAYLTYVTQAGAYLVAQYVTVEGDYYGELLNAQCEVLAKLPYLCDVIEERLIFDYPTGDLREIEIYSREELMEIGKKQILTQ